MPEIAEVARIVHYIRKLLVGKTIAKVSAQDDPIVYGKVGTSAAEFEQHMTGKTVVDAGQQGKYFWMIMSSPPHPVMHFGMTGWMNFKSEHTYYYQPKAAKKKDEPWPPKFVKFMLETEPEKGEDAVEAAFVDMRRLARIRLVDCPAAEIRQNTPLKENGPDPVIDKAVVTVDWLRQKCGSKKVPIKAMLLDQANISGIGNWVGDEVLFNAKIHPEQYANTLKDGQIEQLHKAIHYICSTAVELLGDSDKFPDDWLFRHRWQKGKKNASNTLPSGEKIAFLTVGGRTSAVVPSIQKKTGPVAKDMDEAVLVDGEDEKPKKAQGKKRKAVKEEEEDDEEDEEEKQPKKPNKRGKAIKAPDEDDEEKKPKRSRRGKIVKEEESEDEEMEEDEEEVLPRKTTARGKAQAKKEAKPEPNGNAKPLRPTKAAARIAKETAEELPAKGAKKAGKPSAPDVTSNAAGRRRSGRQSKA
ncbi:formamidopyrimidine-DNA glycosylase [Cladophialophora carrionii CBS 160.54]|uniref:Formamidopyrimidine-DNA glycosylase n=1 Tax=Cladophialophora carrionii CBS 160.54 TaxID=1279043 RepID=V9D4X1_9EURO|nr:formamidopyrimidine-DNA glycosylase [Cladophialophora carrionii CBS 160.54]ETI21934.1 formamidopyrimidine-DNA glycosylase [Cladophialophora carrionii CBS 160.54]